MTLVADLVALFKKQGLLALFLSVWMVAGCQREAQIHTLAGATMGTTWSVKLVGLPRGSDLPAVQRDIQELLESINYQMSTYREDSEISRFNAAEPGTWVDISPDFVRVVDEAMVLAALTEGAYDPTIGPLVNLWGFGAAPMTLTLPDQQALDNVREHIGYQRLQLDLAQGRLFQAGGTYLDLSSVAKGYAVDKLADYLLVRGVENFLVEVGGELRALGQKPGGQSWRVAIERPVAGVREAETVIEVEGMAMATSGDYRNFFEADGRRLSHLIDPRTARPVEHQTGSVTVLSERCSTADAWATALSVLGSEAGMRIAEQQGLAVLFLDRTGDGIEERYSSSFQAILAGGKQ